MTSDFLEAENNQPANVAKCDDKAHHTKDGFRNLYFDDSSKPVDEPPITLEKASPDAGLAKDEFIFLPIGGTYQKEPDDRVFSAK